MMEQAIRRVRKPEITQTAVSRKFGRYKEKTEKRQRKEDLGKSPVLGKISNAFERYLHYSFGEAMIDSNKSGSMDFDEEFYIKAIIMVSGIQYSSSDVEKFSLVLPELVQRLSSKNKIDYLKEKIGMFLTALIDHGKDRNYTIHALGNGKDITWFGYRNRKDVTVVGDIGDYFANRMEGGSITVNGNVVGDAGQYMRGGNITINGNVNVVGPEMKGGKIVIEGDALLIGRSSSGAEIHINGEIFCWERIEFNNGIKAHIYHKGKRIK